VLSRAGSSLVELLVALAIAAIVLASATWSMLRQQRSARWVGAFGAAESQAAHVVRLLPDELALLDAAAGDVVAGQASDTTLELRAVVASAVACDSATILVTLAPDAAAMPPLGGIARAIASGDSLWFLDSLGWRARAVVAASRATTACNRPFAPSAATTRLTLDAPMDAGGGTPLRVTRHERWLFYRASDGRWYLGFRDWNVAGARFNTTQPVAWPFVKALRSGERTGFRFYDSLGSALVPDGTNESRIARVRVTALTAVPAYAVADTVRRDSADAVLARRGVQ